MNQMQIFTVKRGSHTLGRLAHLEPKLMRFGAVIQGWDTKTVKIAVPIKSEIQVGMLLSENCFNCQA